jgi:hypothetical protein
MQGKEDKHKREDVEEETLADQLSSGSLMMNAPLQ